MSRVGVIGLLFLAALPVFAGHVKYAGSDAKGISVVAQHFLRTGTLSLDRHDADYFKPRPGSFDHHLIYLGDRIEYFFPLGPVVFAMPFVAIENSLGVDFTARKADWKLQQNLVVGVAVAMLALLYGFLRSAFSPMISIVTSAGFFYGTLLAPTVAGAFWSVDCEIVVTGLTILLLWRVNQPIGRGRAVAIGILFFLGFLCRPTFATVIVPILIYLAVQNRPTMLITASVSAALLAGFVIFSVIHYGTYLPPYYLASRLSTARAWSAFCGLSVSPSRGVLIFCPFLAVLAFCARFIERSQNPLLLKSLALSMLLQFLSCMTFPKWSGGESFGPRILANFAFLACIVMAGLLGGLQGRQRRNAGWALGMALLIGLPINLPGMFSDYTRLWNEFPDSAADQSIIFDWRYPQFLSISKARLLEKCQAQTRALALVGAPCQSLQNHG